MKYHIYIDNIYNSRNSKDLIVPIFLAYGRSCYLQQ